MSRRIDVTRSGSRDYEPHEYTRLVFYMNTHHRGDANRILIPDLSTATQIAGRTIRAILSEADGREFVVAQGDEGVFVAESYEEALPGTRRLASQARRMAERVERREEFMEQLPQLQAELFT